MLYCSSLATWGTLVCGMREIRQLLGYTKSLRGYALIIAASSIVLALLALVTPIVMKLATDWVVEVVAGRTEFTLRYIGLLVGMLIASAIVGTIAADVGGYSGDQLAIRVRRQLSTIYYKHLLNLPQNYYDGEVTGKIINRLSRAISDVSQFLQFFSNQLLQVLLTIGISVAVLGWYNWVIALLMLLMIPVNLFLTAKTSVKWQAYEKQKNKHFDIASGRFAEVVGQMRLVKSFGSERRELSSFGGRLGSMVKLTAKQSLHWHSMNAIRNIVFGLITTAVMAIIFYQAAHGMITIGDMAMLLALVQQTMFPLRNLSYFVDNYQRAVANSRDYLAAMAEQPEEDDNSRKLVATKGEVVFDEVMFSYAPKGKQRVLHDVSFTVKPGTRLALVGESGGGKTTIANLLMRLYEPDSGQIRIDGTDINAASRRSVREAIATVFQDAALFSGTVRENIAYASPDASDEEIKLAAQFANAHEFIEKLPDGYDTEIGERGIKLSGGQRQRIAIARALIKDAPILILDEATSALDSKAEAQVQQALNHLMKSRTSIIIAHRLSTIADVDTIVTLKNGHVDEVGSPRQLAKTGGIYAELLELQLGDSERAKKRLAEYDIAA